MCQDRLCLIGILDTNAYMVRLNLEDVLDESHLKAVHHTENRHQCHASYRYAEHGEKHRNDSTGGSTGREVAKRYEGNPFH
jgi:hypothetical protein